MLRDIENYCNIWGLKINISKTKVMIFEKGRHTQKDFFIYGEKLEVVTSFKYLGINLYKNGQWNRSQKAIAHHASFAMNRLFSIFHRIDLPISQKLYMFDSLVSSILHFGSEVIGSNPCPDLERIHTKFLRKLLCVKMTTNSSALYGELGRVPLIVIRKLRMLKFWLKVLKSDESSIIRQVYEMLRCDSDNNVTYGGKNWAHQVKLVLQEIGLNYFWLFQNDIVDHISILHIKQRLFDAFYQSWYSDINNSRKLEAYCLFKHSFNREKYLDTVTVVKYRIALTKIIRCLLSVMVQRY